MILEHLAQGLVGHLAVLAGHHLPHIDVLDGMLVGTETEVAAHRLEIRLAQGRPELPRGAGGVETATAVLRDTLDIWDSVGERA